MEKPTFDDVSLSPVTEADFDFIHELKSEENSILWSGFAKKPDYEHLRAHYARRMADPTKITLIIRWKDKKAGLISFTMLNDLECDGYSINVSEKFSGLGLGRLALSKNIDYLIAHYPSCKSFTVWIREDNLRSQKLFKGIGFSQTETVQIRYLAPDNKSVLFQAWTRTLFIWDNVFINHTWGKYPSEDLIRFIARTFYGVPNRSQVRFLELGCGPGANLWYLAREGFRFVGIDGSATAIAQASQRLDEECLGWRDHSELHIGDVGNLPFPTETFDAVIDNECVYCNSYESSERIYSEAYRVLNKGGSLFVRTFASGCWGDGTGQPAGHNAWFCAEGPLEGKGFSRFTSLDELPMLLEGFELRDTELISRSANERKHVITEWIVNAIKPK